MILNHQNSPFEHPQANNLEKIKHAINICLQIYTINKITVISQKCALFEGNYTGYVMHDIILAYMHDIILDVI